MHAGPRMDYGVVPDDVDAYLTVLLGSGHPVVAEAAGKIREQFARR